MAPARAAAEVKPLTTHDFSVEHSLTLPGSPEAIYDAATGDISGWWDHTFSGKPKRFYIEAKPGGGFFEIFDDSGDGVLHATVIYAERGKRLTMRGPLGFNGAATDVVTTYTFTAVGDSTRLDLKVNCAGQTEEGWTSAVDQVWHHFLFEGLKPYVEAGKHLTKER
jgi:hypothetical protein